MEAGRPVRLPNSEEMLAAVKRGVADQPLRNTMADNIAQDPWTAFRAPTSTNIALDDSVTTHNPQGLGFRLVTEKSPNLTKLYGEQDAKKQSFIYQVGSAT